MTAFPDKKLTEEVKPFIAIDTNEAKTKDWNESISPRLESLRSWFNDDNWKQGAGAYLKSQLARRQQHLEAIENDPRSDQFIKGQISMLRQILALPDVIDRQIELLSKATTHHPKGDAGY